jgi:GT2 family glycosyltransferase
MVEPVVSILLVTWKRIDLLEECLQGIAAAKPAAPFETIIVNNAGPRTAARVEAIAAGAQVVHTRRNLGLPGGLRLARSMARGRYLATLQDDVVVEAGWLDRLVERMEEDPWVGIVGSRIELPDGDSMCGLYLYRSASGVRPEPRPGPMPVDLCNSASMLVRARAWDDAGGPSAELFPLAFVDFDLCLRVARCGWIVEVLPRSSVRHKWHQSTPSSMRSYTVRRNGRLVRRWHSTWLAQRPSGGSVDDLRARLEARAAEIRAKPPPAGKEASPLTRADLARLEKIARRGEVRLASGRLAVKIYRGAKAAWRFLRR